jgi:hypothetical protein
MSAEVVLWLFTPIADLYSRHRSFYQHYFLSAKVSIHTSVSSLFLHCVLW